MFSQNLCQNNKAVPPIYKSVGYWIEDPGTNVFSCVLLTYTWAKCISVFDPTNQFAIELKEPYDEYSAPNRANYVEGRGTIHENHSRIKWYSASSIKSEWVKQSESLKYTIDNV